MRLIKCKFFLPILFLLLSSTYLSSCLKLSKTELSSQYFKVPNLYLNFFSEGHKNILIDYLTKNSEWHVTPINGTVIAIKREYGKTCKPAMLPLPSSYPNKRVPYLSANFFNLYPDISKPSDEYVLENKIHENSQAQLKTESNYFEGSHKYETLFLTIESRNKKLSLHVFQPSREAPSIVTTNFLFSTSNELKRLADVALKVNQHTDQSILPPGSIVIAAHQTVLISKSKNQPPGTYTISGYVNPGRKGFVYLKVINKKTGDFMVSDSEGTNAEYVGWSSDSNKKFNFCLGTSLTATAKDEPKVLSEFQLWFKPSDNSPERILSNQTFLADVSI